MDRKHKSYNESTSSSDDDDDRKHGRSNKNEKRNKCDYLSMFNVCDAYGSFYSTLPQTLPLSAPLVFDINQAIYNIDHTPGDGNIYIRRSGFYALTFSLNPDEASQFAIYINNIASDVTTVGTLNSAGQLFSRHILKLKDGDVLTFRNHESGLGTINVPQLIGGAGPGVVIDVTMFKIAPLTEEKECYKCEKMNCECSYKHMKYIRELENQYRIRNTAYASVYTTTSQAINVNSPVIFTHNQILNNITHDLNTSDLKIGEDGMYYFIFLASTLESAQFTIFVNGQPVTSTTTGINKGANTIQLRQILQLKKGDTIAVYNYTSSSGIVNLSTIAGGQITGMTSTFLLFKIAPIPLINNQVFVEDEKQYESKDKELVRYCRNNIGSTCYFSVYGTTLQILNIGDALIFPNNSYKRNVYHKNGKPEITVLESGVFFLMADVQSAKPSQFTIFINGNPYTPNATSGTDSGAGQMSIRQLVPLNKNDVLTVVNYSSILNPINTSTNLGGTQVSVNISFVGFKISDLPKGHKFDKLDPPNFSKFKRITKK